MPNFHRSSSIYLIAFSHLDLFWAGTREECLSRGNLIIRRALDLLDAYPEFKFMIETTNFIDSFLDCFPEEKERIGTLAAAGRLELIPMRAGIYSHFPSGETTIRNLLYGMELCRTIPGVTPKIMSISDIPGAIPQLPQIVAKAGLDGVVVSRGFPPGIRHFRWRAPDGSAVRAYCPLHYDTFVNLFRRAGHEDFAPDQCECALADRTGEENLPEMMHYGTDIFAFDSAILESIRRWNREGRRPLKFSTFREFFSLPAGDAPELQGEAPSAWPNLESSWPDIWPQDLNCEEALHLAEYFQGLNLAAGFRHDPEALKRAWLLLLDSMDHNQNGIGGDAADADKLELKTTARAVARDLVRRLSRRLTARVTVPHKFAFPIVVFNPLSWKRSELVTGRTALYGDTLRNLLTEKDEFRMIDQAGNEIPCRVVCRRHHSGDTAEVEFLAEDVPALGCKVWYLEPGVRRRFPGDHLVAFDRDVDRTETPRRNAGCDRFENRFFRLEIDRVTGDVRVYDKTGARTLFRNMAVVGVEERRGAYIENMTPSGRVFPAQLRNVELLQDDALALRVVVSGSVYGCNFQQILTLPAHAPEIGIENIIDWNGENGWVRIEQLFPFPEEEEAVIRYGSPFGQVKFPETVFSPAAPPPPCDAFRLSRLWVDVGGRNCGVTIGSDHREWEFEGNTLRAYMVRGIGWCTGAMQVLDDGTFRSSGRPPAGQYRFRYRLRPHAAAAGPELRCGWNLNFPPYCVAATDTTRRSARPGLELPAMPDTSGSTVVVSAVKPAENGKDIVFRCFESMGKSAALTLPKDENSRWFEADLLEEHRIPAGTEIGFKPFEIKTLICSR